MKLYPIYAALSNLYEFYGIDSLDEDTFELYALSAYRRIGNQIVKTKTFKAVPQKDKDGDWYICLPEDCESVEAITLPFGDAQATNSNYNRWLGYTHPIEQTIEYAKRDPDDLYIPGKFVKYQEIGNRIYFKSPYKEVNVLYKGNLNDDQGLPLCTEKEIEAIAAYCAYLFHYKRGISTKDSGSLQIAAALKKDWLQYCSQARIPETISQNMMNQILDAAVSHDRHMYGRTTKPIY